MLSSIKLLGSTFNTYLKQYLIQIIVVIVGVVAFQGWRTYQKWITTSQTVLQTENIAYKKQIAKLVSEYDTLASEKKSLEAKNAVLDSDAQYWKKKAQSIIVPPTPSKPPTSDLVLIEELKLAGVDFKPLPDTNLITGRETLPIVWTWNKQYLRVPSLELKLGMTEAAASKFEAQTIGLKEELVVANDIIKKASDVETIRKEQEANLNRQVKQAHKEVVAAEINGYIKAGAALVIGYLGGRAAK